MEKLKHLAIASVLMCSMFIGSQVLAKAGQTDVYGTTIEPGIIKIDN